MSALARIVRVSKYLAVGGATAGTVALLHNNDYDVSTIGLVRFGRAAFAVGAIAIDYKISLRGVDQESPEALDLWSTVHQRSADRLLKLCSTNGGVFIKVGQHIGALDYIVPPEYCSTLKVLHSHAPKSSLEDVRKVIAVDLGKEPEEVFSNFEDEPLGTASLAQVHKAILKETGETVAVKVQHPRVKKHSLVDLATMDMLVRLVEYNFPDFSFSWIADEMKRNLPLELDFLNEGRNADRVKNMLSHLKWLRIPNINWSHSSTRVLTMEYLEGGEVTNKEYMNANKIDVREVSNRITQMYCEMVFTEGFVHCDPHPGNILVRQTKNGPEISLLDHGLYTFLPEKFRINYSQMWLAIINADVDNIRTYGKELGAGELFPLLACILAAKPWESLAAGLTKMNKKTDGKKEVRLMMASWQVLCFK